MRRTLIITITPLALLAACNSAPSSLAPTAASSPPAASPPPIQCADISADLAKIVQDLKTEEAQLQAAWVSGGDQADLQTLINDVQTVGSPNANNNGSALESDASQFYTDASQYLMANSPFLAPGWQSGYAQVTADINSMATDCNLATAPPGNNG